MRVKAIKNFKDKKNNCIREAGHEFTEETERAMELLRLGYAVALETDKTKAVETAVKEVKKEVAVEKKEKATPKKKTEEKKNAKK